MQHVYKKVIKRIISFLLECIPRMVFSNKSVYRGRGYHIIQTIISFKEIVSRYDARFDNARMQLILLFVSPTLHYPNTFTTVAEHFNSKGHSMNDFSFMPIDKINNNWKRLLKETEWMYKLNTVLPDGMNTKLLY